MSDNRLDMQDINEALSNDIKETKQLLSRVRRNAGMLMAEYQRKESKNIERRCVELVADSYRLAALWNIADESLDT